MSTFQYEQDGEVKRTSASFFRGSTTNFHPTNNSFEQADFIDSYIMKGWAPGERFVTKSTPIVAFGSCFASNISNYLHDGGYNILTKRDNKAYITKMGDGLVNTHAILGQFEWAWLGKVPSGELWHGYSAEEFGYDEAVRLDTKALLDEAELFIITLGLSEIWYDEPTGEVFWRAVPKDRYDPTRHKFRVATHAETLQNIRAVRDLIRRFRPEAHILFSVSPIPLTATFRPVSCLSADAASKAILKCALDEFLRESADPNLHYFPSYEAVKRLFSNQWSVDRRHVYPHVLTFNMMMFEHYFCTPGVPMETLREIFNVALAEDARLGRQGQVNDGLSYSEIRRQKIEARKEARRQAAVAERVAAREEAARLKKKAGRLKWHGIYGKTAALVLAAAGGFILNGFLDVL